jgi:hypothetical protein
VKTSNRQTADRERVSEAGSIKKPMRATTVSASAPFFCYLWILVLAVAVFNFSLGDGSDTWEEVNVTQ